MKKRNKALLTVVCAVLLVVVSVMGTLAYLTDQDTAVNTFTVGKVYIDLDEAVVNEAGEPLKGDKVVENVADADRTQNVEGKVEGNKYHLIPGHTYTKDPMVTVLEDSEACYVRMFVEVENMEGLTDALEDISGYWAGDLFLLQNLCVDEEGELTWNPAEWEFVEYKSNKYEFRYVGTEDDKVAKAGTDTVLPALFTKITLPGEYFGNTETAAVANVKINITAQAIQADGFADADAAWAAWK